MSPSQTAVLVVSLVFTAAAMIAVIVAAVILNRRHDANLEILRADYDAKVAPFYAALTLSDRAKRAGQQPARTGAPDESPTESRTP